MRNVIYKILKEELHKKNISESSFNNKKLLIESETSNDIDFNVIYSKMWDKMLKQVCLKYTKDVDKAQDYCQEGFMKVLDKLHTYNNQGSLEGWVRMVIRNSIIDSIRKRKIEYLNDEPNWSTIGKDLQNEPYIEETVPNIDMVKSVLPKLSPKFRKVFELYHFKKMNHQQISDLLGISVGTSKSNLARARVKVKGMVKDLYGV